MREVAVAQAMEGLEESLREHFTKETVMSAAEWERVRDRIVFVHDQLPRERIGEIVWEWAGEGLDEEDEDEVSGRIPDGAAPRAAFEALNATLPSRWRFEKVGVVNQPVEADVYCAPAEE